MAAVGGAFGAALVAGVGIGVWPDARSAALVCKPLTRQAPDAAAGETLRQAFAIFEGLYPALSQSFAAISDAALDR